MELNSLKKEIIKGLYKIGAIKIGNFKLKSGDLSPFYIDLRLVPSYPEIFSKVNEAYAQKFQEIYGPRRDIMVGGIMSAGIPFATALCMRYGLPLLQIRSEPKKHGTGKLIEGKDITKGDEILLLDDLISTGTSKVKPKVAIEEEGGIVKNLLVLVDRTSESSKTSLDTLGMELHSFITLFEIVDVLKEFDKISKEEFKILNEAIREWI